MEGFKGSQASLEVSEQATSYLFSIKDQTSFKESTHCLGDPEDITSVNWYTEATAATESAPITDANLVLTSGDQTSEALSSGDS